MPAYTEEQTLINKIIVQSSPDVQGVPENWREKVADLIKAAHGEGQKSATGRDPTQFRWVNSESYKAAQALLAAPTPDDGDNPFGPGPSESPDWLSPWSPCPNCGSNKNVTPDYGSADFGFDGPMFCFSCEIEFPR